MVKKALNKINNTIHYSILEKKKAERKRLNSEGNKSEAIKVQEYIVGYTTALRVCGIITERERQVLYIYYGTI